MDLFRFPMRTGNLRVEHLSLISGDSNLSVTGAIPVPENAAPCNLSLQGRLVLNRFSSLFPELQTSDLRGVAQLSATVTRTGQHWTPDGFSNDPGWRFHVAIDPPGIEGLSGRFSIDDAIIHTEQISGAIGTGRFSIAGSLPLCLISTAFAAPTTDPGQPARVSAHVDDLRFTIGKDEKKATASFGLKIAAEAPGLNLDALQGTLEFSEFRLQTGDGDLQQTTPTRINITRGKARLESLNAKGSEASLAASGSIDLTGEQRLQLDAAADVKLAVLAGLLGPVESAGRMQLDAHVEGTLIEPRITGLVTLEQAALSLTEPLLQATQVNLKATIAGDAIKIGEFSGTLNGGSFTGGGDLKLTRGNVVDSSLQASAKDVFLEYPAGLKTTSSLGLKLVMRNSRPTLEGNIKLRTGIGTRHSKYSGPART